MEHSQAERIKNSYQEINFVENIQEVEALFWTLVVLVALQCYCGDNEYKTWTSLKKILVSKNATTWPLH